MTQELVIEQPPRQSSETWVLTFPEEMAQVVGSRLHCHSHGQEVRQVEVRTKAEGWNGRGTILTGVRVLYY